jgi:hypothetical protein
MPLVLKDRVKETSTTTGTGTFTLAGAVAGFQSFSAVGNGNTTYYAIVAQSPGDWEVGIGTYTASGTTLARTTILASSNGGSAVNFAAGVKEVFVTYPADQSFGTLQGLNPRVVTIADGTSITMDADTTDLATQTNTQVAGTLTLNAPTGTPVNGQKLILRVQCTNVQTLSYNAIFAGSTDIPLPTATSGSSRYDYLGFMYNTAAVKWQLIARAFGF